MNDEDLQWFDPAPKLHIYRKEVRVSSALTISELLIWEQAECVPDLQKWFDTHLDKQDAVIRTKNYQQHIFKLLWLKSKPSGRIDPNLIRAINDAVNISTIDWANIDYQINLTFLNDCMIFRRLLSMRDDVDQCIDHLKCSTIQENEYKFKTINATVKTHGDWLCFEAEGDHLAIPWIALLAVQDSIVGLVDVCIHQRVTDQIVGTANYSEVIKVIELAFQSVIELGCQVYNVLKSWLSITIGKILNDEPEGYVNDLYESVRAGMPASALTTYLIRGRLIEQKDKIQQLQLSGLMKCFTYPIVDIQKARDTVVDKAFRIFHNCFRAGERAAWMWTKIVIREYVRRHRTWPPTSILGDVPANILQARESGTWNEEQGTWHPDYFQNIWIDKCMDFNWYIDPTELLSDKSLAVGLKSWPREYDMRYHKIHYDRHVKAGPIKNKRVIIEHIKRKVVNVRDSIMSVLKSEYGSDNRMFVMCLKERELSMDRGRNFTKLPFDVRMYQVALESNVKNSMKYFPKQSMTMSGPVLAKFLVSASREVCMKISVDYAKWCLHQHFSFGLPLAMRRDRAFGVRPLYEYMQRFPELCYALFQDRGFIPEQDPNTLLPLPGPRCCFGLKMLGEGMLQGGWTDQCVSYEEYCLYPLGFHIEITASGDNNYIKVKVPAGRDPLEVQQLVLAALHRMSEECGLPLKLEETFTSDHYFEYGKNSFLDGKKVGMGIKRASRIGSESQETLPSLNSKLSSIFSTAVACAGEDMCPIPAYVTALYEAGRTLNSFGKHNIEPGRLTACFLLSRSLGGMKMTNYANFCARGVIDNAAYNLNLIMTLKRHKAKFPHVLENLLRIPIRRRKFNAKAALKDPFVLSLSTPESAEYWLKDRIEEALAEEVENQALKPLFTRSAVVSEDQLVQDLLTMEPSSLKVMAVLYQHANPALREKAIGRFQSSTSVNILVSHSLDMVSVRDRATQNDQEMIKFYTSTTKTINFLGPLLDYSCPTAALDKFRCDTTGLQLTTPSMPPPTHQFYMLRWKDVPEHLIPRTIKVIVHPSIINVLLQRGNKQTYLGSNTRIKRAKSPMEVINPDPMELSVIALAELSTWLGGDPFLQALIDQLIREKTSTLPGYIKEACRRIIGGTIEHRANIMTVVSGAFTNYDINIMSHIEIITDTATDFARKLNDVTLLFQGVKVCIGSYIIHHYLGGQVVTGDWGCVLECETCTRPVYTGDYRLTRAPLYQGVMTGLEHIIRFTNQNLPAGGGDPYIGSHVYNGEMLARSITDWERLEKITETDSLDHGDLTHDPKCNISEISRSSVVELLKYIFMYLHLKPLIYDMLTRTSYSQSDRVINPVSIVMNTLLVAGQLQNLMSLSTGMFSHRAHDGPSKLRLFLFLLRTYDHEFMSRIEYILPSDSYEVALNVCRLKNEHTNSELDIDGLLLYGRDRVQTISGIMGLLGIQYTLSHEACTLAVRAHKSTTTSDEMCTLETHIRGTCLVEDPEGSLINYTTTYGLTAYSSQLWCTQHLFPKLPILTLKDRSGSIGVVMGHRGIPSYIHDGTPSRYVKTRITNGPIALQYDQCTDSYNRNYYIANLGTSVPARPSEEQLIIISKKDPREGEFQKLIRRSDILISRDPKMGGPLIGFPRRFESDIWYTTYLPSVSVLPMQIGNPTLDAWAVLQHHHNLAPSKRVARLIGKVDPSRSDLREFVERELQQWQEQVEYRKVANLTAQEKLENIKRLSVRNFSEDDVLTLYWLQERIAGSIMPKMIWHKTKSGDFHIGGCNCEDKKLRYAPPDELLGIYLVGQFHQQLNE